MDALVTCMYNGLSGTPFGGRLHRDAHYRESLATIAGAGLPIVCFTAAAELAGHRNYFASLARRGDVRFVALELDDIPYSAQMQAIKANDPTRYGDLPWRERCVQIMWGKLTMLELALALERCADNVYWIDAGLANANIISTRYITEEALAAGRLCDVGPAFPPRLFERIRDYIGDRLLVLKSTTPHHPGIPESYNARPYENGDGVVAGLLGGPRRQVARLCDLFAEKAAALIRDQVLYFEESILTGIYADHPEMFEAFTFDSWYHEGWACCDPDQTSFSQFFDLMLESTPPATVLGFPYTAPRAIAPLPSEGASSLLASTEETLGAPIQACFVTVIDSIEPFEWGLDIERVGMPLVVFCGAAMADEVRRRAPSPQVTLVVQEEVPPETSLHGKISLLLQAAEAGYYGAERYFWLDCGLLTRHLSFEYLYSGLFGRALAKLSGDVAYYFAVPGYPPSSLFGGPRSVLSAAAQRWLDADEDVLQGLFETTSGGAAPTSVFRRAFDHRQLEDPNVYLAAAAIAEPVLHVIGDSHVYNCFTPNRLIGCRARVLLRTTDASSFSAPYAYQLSHHLGGFTMHRAGRQGELLAVARQSAVKDGDAVVWVFGEIDVRCHVLKRHEIDGTPVATIIATLAENYVRGMREVQARHEGLVQVVFAPIPPLDNPNYQSTDYPVHGTIEQRVGARRLLCAELARSCGEHGFLFVDAAEHFETARGDLQWDLSDHFCHIAAAYQGPIIEKTYRLLGEAAGYVAASSSAVYT